MGVLLIIKKIYMTLSMTMLVPLVSIAPGLETVGTEPAGLHIFRESYPNVNFTSVYDPELGDFLITITAGNQSADLYWQDSRFLPFSELENKDMFLPLLYEYEKEVADPATFTQEDIDYINEYSSVENRRNGPCTPPYLYDVVYDCLTHQRVEKHIKNHMFLGKRTKVHEEIIPALDRIQKRLKELSAKDAEVKTFIEKLSSADGYNWRTIRDSRNRSFHSLGIAIDVLPKGWGSKNVYWAWRRDIDPDRWMLLPLERRWMPPAKVIEVFEEEGFIYGGKWLIWDNMHFEYRPEVIRYSIISRKDNPL